MPMQILMRGHRVISGAFVNESKIVEEDDPNDWAAKDNARGNLPTLIPMGKEIS